MRITRDRIVRILGPAPKPEKVWEEQFDYNNNELGEMAEWIGIECRTNTSGIIFTI